MGSTVLLWIAGALLATVLVGFVRVEIGPTRADRMLSAQLFGTSSVAILLIFSIVLDMPSLVDVALGLALLAAIAATAFVKRAWRPDEDIVDTAADSTGDAATEDGGAR